MDRFGLESLSPTDREEILFWKEGSLWRCWVCNLPAVDSGGFTARRRSGRGSFFDQHKSCFDLPTTITNHPLHPDHPLNLSPTPEPAAAAENSANKKPLIRCSQCRDVCGVSAYVCVSCDFTLDVKCASLTEAQCERVQNREVKINLLHFTHYDHVLSLCNWRQEFGLSCSACNGKLSDGSLAYCCMKCSDDEFIIHESCAKFPTMVLHPYHEHPLSVPTKHSYKLYTSCYACRGEIYGLPYQCTTTTCRFKLHLRCANRTVEAIKLANLHKHDLFYFKADDLGISFVPCDVCHNYCSGSIYSCVKCSFCVESACIPVPATIKHDHMHSLTYVESVASDYDSKQEFYCFACETERDPRLPFYNCDKCPYTAHISCILAKDRTYCDGMFDKGEQRKSAEEAIALSDIDSKLSRLALRIEKEKTETEAMKAKLKILMTLLKQSEESKDT